MTEVICFDGKFASDKLAYYKQYGVSRVPIQESIYNIRAVITNSNGKKGFLLEEIINPAIPITGHPYIPGTVLIEPNFSVYRFTDLEGNSIIDEMLREAQNKIKIKDFVLIKNKQNEQE